VARTSGRPTSSNGASSFHAWWGPEPAAVDQAGVTITIRTPPAAEDLYFWAFQVSFAGRFGRAHGAGHLGVMWNPRHPDHGAANWGGYDPSGTVLPGPAAGLASATHNPNTFDYRWHPGRPYRLTVSRTAGGWHGTVTDADGTATLIRTLAAGGDRLVRFAVWSEVFAACDAPPAEVAWSDPWFGEQRPDRVRLTYQEEQRGGCTNTSTTVEEGVLVQRTTTVRPNRPGDTLPWPLPS
jgi:hypothetical protein